MKIILGIGFGSIALILAGFLAPLVLRSTPKLDQTQATSNARQLGMALFDFESEYGRFPDETTIAEVQRRTGNSWALKGGTSNDLLKQLIAAGITQSEEIFYSKSSWTKRADNVISSEAKALGPGECGFAYLPPGKLEGLHAARPLAVAPLIPGTMLFDPEPFDGKAVVLMADNSVRSFTIRKDGRAIAPGGGDLLDPSQPYWGGVTPVIKWPEANFKTP